MWSEGTFKAIYGFGLGLGLKLSKGLTRENILDTQRDFSVAFPVWALLEDIKYGRHVFVCIKNVLKLRKKEIVAIEGPFKGPKSYYLKTVMAYLKEETYKNEDASMAELFTDCLRKTLKAYQQLKLKHFLIPEVNLLMDVEQSDQERTIKLIKSVLDDPIKYLTICRVKRMEASSFCLSVTKGIISTPNAFGKYNLIIANALKMILRDFNYEDHEPSREKSLEARFTKEFFDEFCTLILRVGGLPSRRGITVDEYFRLLMRLFSRSVSSSLL